MSERVCRGLPAGWLNGWLAAVGATVLDSRLRLHWTTEDSPVAVLSAESLDPVDALVESWPSRERLNDLPIAADWRNAGKVERRVAVDDFRDRAVQARGTDASWTLSSTLTDLSVDQSGNVAHAPFDAAGPGTIKWLHYRVLRVHEKVGPPSRSRLGASLVGHASRVKDAGLGFDQSRLGSLADKTDPWVEPFVELLAFFGLALFPMRASGADQRNRGNPEERQRGWRRPPGRDQPREFLWPAWCQAIDTWGIDALLDIWEPRRRGTWRSVGVHAGWRSVRYEPQAQADATRAIGAERL
ncbi:MAG: hypothetical protein F4Y26_06025 [Gammaproteobacteria bacterium]|nr:hypothetical protein [Gammaproteobacteria bacterium]